MKTTKHTLLFFFLVMILVGILPAQKTNHVVIVVLDGARYSETFGDSFHTYIPAMWNTLRPLGTIYTSYYNNGRTQTNPGHASILSGVWQYIANDGSEYSKSPSIFEYYRKQRNAPAADCWVALGKNKLNVLANSTLSDYGSTYGASVRTSSEEANDLLAYDNIRYVLTNHRSRITISNFPKIDIEGHAGSWENYLGGIKWADTLVASLWKFIQADSVLKNKTTMIVTNDHGRHTTDFVNHGDGCDGCRHILLMILGPDTPKGIVDSNLYSQIDIAPTVAKMMRFSTPLSQGKVIESAISAAANVSISMPFPLPAKISGIVNLHWSVGAVKESLTTLVEVSQNGSESWTPLLNTMSKDSSFAWNTQSVFDGTRYRVRIQVFGDTTYGITQSSQNFTIDNPGNGAPDVVLLSPNRNIIVSGTEKIEWSADDAEGDILSLSIYASSNNGTNWQPIANNLSNSASYNWNTKPSANSTSSRVKIICSDGSSTTEIISPMFEVYNIRPTINSVKQIGGTGTGGVAVNISDESQLTGDTYHITFSDSNNSEKQFSVKNLTKNVSPLINIPFPGDGSEGPLFDGIRLSITDFPEPIHNPDSTKWIKGNSTLFSKVNLPELVLPEGNVQAIPEAADYEIRISNTIVDTSRDYFGALATQLYFTVFNTTMNRKTPIVLTELSPDGKISFGDDLYLFKKDSAGKDLLTWEVFIDGDVNSTNPQPGDIFRIATYKPITNKDIFEFSSVLYKLID